ncbi:MAG: hypothetical protein K1X56_11525, partial [Flavobacteriales bacterium]|nr:hypothetical protein [Flavobacteriales bacterium]
MFVLSLVRMKKIALPLLVFLAACGSEAEPKEEKKDSVVSESFEAMPIKSDYTYIIIDKKTGEEKTLNQEEYLASPYLDNPDFEVREEINAQ